MSDKISIDNFNLEVDSCKYGARLFIKLPGENPLNLSMFMKPEQIREFTGILINHLNFIK